VMPLPRRRVPGRRASAAAPSVAGARTSPPSRRPSARACVRPSSAARARRIAVRHTPRRRLSGHHRSRFLPLALNQRHSRVNVLNPAFWPTPTRPEPKPLPTGSVAALTTTRNLTQDRSQRTSPPARLHCRTATGAPGADLEEPARDVQIAHVLHAAARKSRLLFVVIGWRQRPRGLRSCAGLRLRGGWRELRRGGVCVGADSRGSDGLCERQTYRVSNSVDPWSDFAHELRTTST
jgi:hypothetical protein